MMRPRALQLNGGKIQRHGYSYWTLILGSLLILLGFTVVSATA